MRRITALLTLVLFVVVTAAPALACLAQGDSTPCCCKATSDTSTAICPVNCCSTSRQTTTHPVRDSHDLPLRPPSLAFITLPMPQDSALLPLVARQPDVRSLGPPLRLRI